MRRFQRLFRLVAGAGYPNGREFGIKRYFFLPIPSLSIMIACHIIRRKDRTIHHAPPRAIARIILQGGMLITETTALAARFELTEGRFGQAMLINPNAEESWAEAPYQVEYGRPCETALTA